MAIHNSMVELCCYAAPIAIGIPSKSSDLHRVFQHPQNDVANQTNAHVLQLYLRGSGLFKKALPYGTHPESDVCRLRVLQFSIRASGAQSQAFGLPRKGRKLCPETP
jgi:hypothetical protein